MGRVSFFSTMRDLQPTDGLVRLGLVCVCSLLPFAAPLAFAAEDLQLERIRVARDTHAFIGQQTSFIPENAGNMMNAGFIVTQKGVVVIDTGLTKKLAEAMLASIREITAAPIHLVINTHFHPDHTFGNSVFAAQGAPVMGTAAMRDQLAAEGPQLLENIMELVNPWAEGTTLHPPDHIIESDTYLDLGDHRLEILLFENAHTESDLVVLDPDTGALFASDLVFHESAPATPNADLEGWVRSVKRLRNMPWTVMVPGHGPPLSEASQLQTLENYLIWLPQTIEDSVLSGDDINDLLARSIPAPYGELALASWQFQRSVLQYFPEAEARMFEGQ